MAANYAVQITVHMQRLDNKRLTPEESRLVEEMHAAAQEAAAAVMAKHDQHKLQDLGKVKVDY